MDADGVRRPRSFEDAAFALVQALSPGKHLNKEHIPFKHLRQVITDFVGESRQQIPALTGGESPTTASDSSKLYGIEEKNGGSNLDLSDDSSSRISFDDSVTSRSKIQLQCKGLERLSAKGPLNKISKRSRKLMQNRSQRAESLQTKDLIQLDCTEVELAARFSSVYNEQLTSRPNSVEVFYVLLNSLRNFFHHNTWSDNVEEFFQRLVNSFLENIVLKKHEELEGRPLSEHEKNNVEVRLKEYELMILIELHLMQLKSRSPTLEESDIIRKMRHLYFSGGTDRMHKFLETMTDLFAQALPGLLLKTYESLCICLPLDLEEYAKMDTITVETETNNFPSPAAALKTSQSEHLDRLIKDDSDVEYKPSTSAVADFELAPAKPKRSLKSCKRKAHVHISKNKKDKESIPISHAFTVPETPEAKVKKRKQPCTTELDDHRKTIKQTPLAKMSKLGSKRVNKYTSLLRASRTALTSDAVQPPVTYPPRKFSTRAQARELFLPSPVQPSSSSFTISCHPNGLRKPSFQEKLAQCVKSTAVDSSPSGSQNEEARDFVLEKQFVDRYRKRLDHIRYSHKKSDKNEVFYGRSAKRNNLFEKIPNDEHQSGVTTRSSCSVIQKNRSGRAVVSNRVHLAHALLNVHNNNPLCPSKAPKYTPFKLRRMVRPAQKTDRKRLVLLKTRCSNGRPTEVLPSDNSLVSEAPSSSVSVES